MSSRLLVVGIALAILLSFAVVPATAGRLGGAYRGPYEDRTRPAAEDDPGAADPEGGPDAAAPGSKQETGEPEPDEEGTAPDGTAPADPPPGDEGDDEGAGSRAPAASNPPDGERSEPAEPAPDAGQPTLPGTGGPTPGTGPPSLSGRRSGGSPAIEDVLAYWPFWFEHNKEWILSELLESRSGATKIGEGSSVSLFGHLEGEERRVPITEEQRKVLINLLVDLTKHSHEWVRDAAVIALGKIGLPEVVPHLAACVKSDRSPAVRQDALLALGLTRRKEAVAPLLAALDSDRLRPYAPLGLALLGYVEVLPRLLKEYEGEIGAANPEVAASLAIAIGHLGDESVVEDLAAPLSRRADIRLKVYVCHALARVGGDKARSILLMALASRDRDVQAAAALSLSAWDDSTVLGRLAGKDGVKSGNRMAKLFALVSLGRISSGLEFKDSRRRSVRLVLREMAEKPLQNKYAAMFGALALGVMGDDAGSRFFAEALGADKGKKYSPENRSAVALSCGLLGQKEMIRRLQEILCRDSNEADYRGYAAFALGVLGDRASKEVIKGLLKENRQRHEVLRSGCWALGLLGGPSDVEALMDVLKRGGPSLHTARGAAALAIGMAGDGTTVDKLVTLIQEAPEHPTRAFAIAALGCLLDDTPISRIPQLLRNVHYRVELPVFREVMSIL